MTCLNFGISSLFDNQNLPLGVGMIFNEWSLGFYGEKGEESSLQGRKMVESILGERFDHGFSRKKMDFLFGQFISYTHIYPFKFRC